MSQDQWCFSWLQPKIMAGTARAVVLREAIWDPGNVITVSFMDGSKALQKRVWEAAQAWVGDDMANLTFARREKDGLIRISFKQRGSWSAIGTTCRNVAADQPTMNFGWLTNESALDEIRPVVWHEFGHALGLVHEHQHPAGGIRWNRKVVMEELTGGTSRWTRQQVENNVFKAYEKSKTKATRVDPHSIMMYPIPARWTDGFSAGTNTEISLLDRELIRKIYPH